MLAAVLLAATLGVEPSTIGTTEDLPMSGENTGEVSIPGMMGRCKRHMDTTNQWTNILFCSGFDHMPNNLTTTATDQTTYPEPQYVGHNSWGTLLSNQEDLGGRCTATEVANAQASGGVDCKTTQSYLDHLDDQYVYSYASSDITQLYLSGHPFQVPEIFYHWRGGDVDTGIVPNEGTINIAGTDLGKNLFADTVAYPYLVHHPYASRLSEVGDEAFRGCPFTEVKNLVMSNMYITSIGEYAFAGLPNVLSINLDFNLINFVNEKAFRNITNLQNLQMQYNEITYLAPLTLSELPNLRGFLIRRNKIDQLNINYFLNFNLEAGLSAFSHRHQRNSKTGEYRVENFLTSNCSEDGGKDLCATSGAGCLNWYGCRELGCTINFIEGMDPEVYGIGHPDNGGDYHNYQPIPRDANGVPQFYDHLPYCDVHKSNLAAVSFKPSDGTPSFDCMANLDPNCHDGDQGKHYMDNWRYSLTHTTPSNCVLNPCSDGALACPFPASASDSPSTGPSPPGPTPPGPSPPPAGDNNGVSTGVIVGASVGGVVGLGIIGFVISKSCGGAAQGIRM